MYLRLREPTLPPRRTEAGFTLLELLVIVGILGVVMAISAGSLMGFVRDSKANSGMSAVINTFRVAKDRAIGERRNFEVAFVSPNRITVSRAELPGPTKTVVIDTYLQGNLEFLLVSGANDTPDGFVTGTMTATSFGTSPTRMFTSEGTFVDSIGDPMNGTLFIAAKGQPTTGRAITILGATALLRGWRYDGRQWVD